MREDYSEALDKMFPNGYVITFIQPNTNPAYHWYNPKEDEFINAYLDMLDDVFNEDCNDGDCEQNDWNE